VDRVARAWPNVTFIATTNYLPGVDAAFLSRADLVETIGTPGLDAVRAILADTLGELTGGDALDVPDLDAIAAEAAAAGLDARQVRKLALRAVTSRRELTVDPSGLTIDDLATATREAVRETGREAAPPDASS
jgi:hypothetical protein